MQTVILKPPREKLFHENRVTAHEGKRKKEKRNWQVKQIKFKEVMLFKETEKGKEKTKKQVKPTGMLGAFKNLG